VLPSYKYPGFEVLRKILSNSKTENEILSARFRHVHTKITTGGHWAILLRYGTIKENVLAPNQYQKSHPEGTRNVLIRQISCINSFGLFDGATAGSSDLQTGSVSPCICCMCRGAQFVQAVLLVLKIQLI
jgi:hypothetical protein